MQHQETSGNTKKIFELKRRGCIFPQYREMWKFPHFFSFYPSLSKYLTRDIVLTSAPVEGGEVDPSDPVDGLGQHEDGGDTNHGDCGQAPDIWEGKMGF